MRPQHEPPMHIFTDSFGFGSVLHRTAEDLCYCCDTQSDSDSSKMN